MLDQADKVLAKAAVDKIRAGQTPNAREAEALKRFEKDREETSRWEHYRTVPSKHYKEMSGRGARVLIDQQAKWGIPVAGKTVDLTKVLRSMHDFIAAHAQRLLNSEGGSGPSKALERYRTALAVEKEMEVAQKQGRTFDLDEVKEISLMFTGNVVRCLNIMEVTLATEVEIWFIDPAFRAMSAEERRRVVLAWAQKMVRAVRQDAADGFLAMMERTRREMCDEAGYQALGGAGTEPGTGAGSGETPAGTGGQATECAGVRGPGEPDSTGEPFDDLDDAALDPPDAAAQAGAD